MMIFFAGTILTLSKRNRTLTAIPKSMQTYKLYTARNALGLCQRKGVLGDDVLQGGGILR
jgi:hypothetical protein